MNLISKPQVIKVLVAITAITLFSSQTQTIAASKTITCYKGSVSKKVTSANPKCPTGYSTKKPVATPTVKATAATPVKTTTGPQTFNATYKGSMRLLWSASDVKALSVTATATGTDLGLVLLTGTGGAAPTGQCDIFFGSGTLAADGSPNNSINVKFDVGTACADSDTAPTDVKITGNVLVTGGAGKFAGATGTLKVGSGSGFQIRSTTAGYTLTESLTLILSGTITTK